MRLAVTTLVGGLLAGFAAQAQSVSGLKQGMSYSAARELMISQGYSPLDFPKEEQRQRCWERPEICQTYPETDGCAGTGQGECRFVFQGAKDFVVITTVGERLPDLRYQKSSRASQADANEYRRYLR